MEKVYTSTKKGKTYYRLWEGGKYIRSLKEKEYQEWMKGKQLAKILNDNPLQKIQLGTPGEKLLRSDRREQATHQIITATANHNHEFTPMFYDHSSEDMFEIPDATVHLIVTSPPYNISIPYDGYEDNIPHEQYRQILLTVLQECHRILVEGGRIALNVPTILSDKVFAVSLIPPLLEAAGLTLRETLIWQKSNNQIPEGTAWGSWLSPSNPVCRAVTEFIFVAHKNSPSLQGDTLPTILPDEFREWTRNLWFMHPTSDEKHPAVFPVELPERLIKLYSYIGQTIVDPFCGVGTTAIACKKTKRNFIGYDVSLMYCDEAKRRCLIA